MSVLLFDFHFPLFYGSSTELGEIHYQEDYFLFSIGRFFKLKLNNMLILHTLKFPHFSVLFMVTHNPLFPLQIHSISPVLAFGSQIFLAILFGNLRTPTNV